MKLLNLPNTITFLRIVLVPFFITFLLYRYYDYALSVFVLASVSDAVDGFLARRMGQQSEFGRLLDPVADKLLIVSAFVIFTFMNMFPVWFTVIILSRDVFIVMGWVLMFLIFNTRKVQPSLIGKAANAFQMFLVAYTLLGKTVAFPLHGQRIIFWITAVLTTLSGLHYIYRGLAYNHD